MRFIFILFAFFKQSKSDMVKLTNLYRKIHGLPELKVIEPLRLASELQANTMCKAMKLTHRNSNPAKRTLGRRLRFFNFRGINMGENIAKQQNNDFKTVFKVWSRSTQHRKILLGDYKFTAVASCVGRDGNRYWVQVFAKGYGIWNGSPYNKENEDYKNSIDDYNSCKTNNYKTENGSKNLKNKNFYDSEEENKKI